MGARVAKKDRRLAQERARQIIEAQRRAPRRLLHQPYLAFQGVEMQPNQPEGNGYAPPIRRCAGDGSRSRWWVSGSCSTSSTPNCSPSTQSHRVGHRRHRPTGV